MENFNLNRERVEVTIDSLKPGDVVYISNKEDATPYQVLDTGKPFILIENMKSHFANMYRPVHIYKDL